MSNTATAEQITKRAKGDFEMDDITQTNSVSEPLIAHLSEGEQLHYLINHPYKGFRIFKTSGSEQTPHHNLTSWGNRFLLMTDQRLIYIVGKEHKDQLWEFGYGDIGNVERNSGWITSCVRFSTTNRGKFEAGTEFKFASNGQSVEDAVEYIRARMSEVGEAKATGNQSDVNSVNSAHNIAPSRPTPRDTETEDDESTTTLDFACLTQIDGIDRETAEQLYDSGYESVNDLQNANQGELSDIVGNQLSVSIEAKLKEPESDGEYRDSSAYHRYAYGGSQTSESPQQDIDKEDIKHLLNIPDIDREQAEALYKQGYENTESLRTAAPSKIANIAGHEAMVSIRNDIGFVDQSSQTPEPDSRNHATRESLSDDDQETTQVSETAESDGEYRDSSAYHRYAYGGSQTSESPQQDIDKEDIKHLLNIPDIDREQAEALYKQGYENTESLRTAAPSKIANIAGHEAMVSIRNDIGFVDQSSQTPEPDSRNHATRESLSDDDQETTQVSETYSDFIFEPVQPDSNTESSSFPSAGTKEKNSHLQSKKQAVISQLNDAMSDPFQNIDSTHEGLIRCHRLAAELGENAQNTDSDDILSFARSTLNDIEHRIEVLSEISDELLTARALVSSTELSSDSIALDELQSARQSYNSAIELANKTKFDTSKIKYERTDVESAIKRRTEESGSSNDTLDSQASKESSKDVDSDVSESPPSRDDLIAELTKLDESVEGYPMTTDMRENGKYSRQPYFEVFGSWEDALEAADINKEQRLIDDIYRVADITDRTPNTTDMKDHSVYSSGTYSTHFGSWATALEAAGIAENNDRENQVPSNPDVDNQGSDTSTDSDERYSQSDPGEQDYITAIQEYAQETDNVIKSTNFSDYSGYSVQEIVSTFGSWPDALDKANVDNKSRLLAELRRVAERVGHQPSTTEMNEHGRVSATLYRSYFESYTQAKTQAFSNQSDNINRSNIQNEPGEQDYITAIQEYAQETHKVIKSTDFSEFSGYSVQEVIAELGSWHNALDEAGVDNKSRLLDELHRIDKKIGHQPSTTEVNKHGKVSATLYNDYFESFSKAKKSAFSDQQESTKTSDSIASTDNFARINGITEDGRLTNDIALRICYSLDDTSDKKEVSLRVEDLDGTQSWLHIWKTHSIDINWKKGQWYVLSDSRGKQWKNKNDETKRQLSSTNDLRITHIGNNPPTETEAIDSSSETTIEEDTQSDESTEANTDRSEDSDDILDEIMTEFESVSDE